MRSALRDDTFIRRGTGDFRRLNLALFAAGVATFGLLYCVQPLLPELSRQFRISAAASSLSLSLPSGVLAVAMLLAGAMSDACGRKALMAASLLSSSALVLLTSIAADWHALLILRTLLGLTLSGLPAVAMTYLGEEVDNESVGLAMGLYIGGSAVGGMGGRLISGVLSGVFGWRIGVAAIGLLGALAGALFIRCLPPSRHYAARPFKVRALLRRFAGLLADPGLRWLFAQGCVLLGSFVTVYNYIGFRLRAPPYGLSQAEVGLIFGVYLVGGVSSPLIGHLAQRLGMRNLLCTMFAVMLAGLWLSRFESLVWVIGGLAVITFGFFGGHSIVSSWVARRAGGARAQASSLYLFCYYGGSSLAGPAGGLFYAAHGWSGIVAFVGALYLAGLLIAWRLYRLPTLAPPAAAAGSLPP